MIYLGADHAGYELKEKIKKILIGHGLVFQDVGTHSVDPCDFPDYALAVAEKVVDQNKRKGNSGILFCGSGIGMDIMANKVKGVRAALAINVEMAKQAREHNDANILVLAGRFLSYKQAEKIVLAFLKSKFSNLARYKRRLNKISRYEKNPKCKI